MLDRQEKHCEELRNQLRTPYSRRRTSARRAPARARLGAKRKARTRGWPGQTSCHSHLQAGSSEGWTGMGAG